MHLSFLIIHLDTFSVDFVALQEPRCSGIKAQGFSGGIRLLWIRDDIQIDVVKDDFHFLHVNVLMLLGSLHPYPLTFMLTAVYASPRERERGKTWEQLRNLAASIHIPWMLLGGFNSIANSLTLWRRKEVHLLTLAGVWNSLAGFMSVVY